MGPAPGRPGFLDGLAGNGDGECGAPFLTRMFMGKNDCHD
jgi:hypothetical protein